MFSLSYLSASYGFSSSSQSTGGFSVSVVSVAAESEVLSGTLEKKKFCFLFSKHSSLQFNHGEFLTSPNI